MQNLRASDLGKSLLVHENNAFGTAPTRALSSECGGGPVVVFTDGAWEDGIATAGAVLVDGDIRLAFQT